MLALSDRLCRWLTRQNRNLPFIALATFSLPKTLVRSIYAANQRKKLWGSSSACVTLSFDCDFPADAEALPDLAAKLRVLGIRASFAVVGCWVEKYPREHQALLDGGHEIVNHTYSHPDNELLNPGRKFRTISRDDKTEEIHRCHEICERILGVSPRGLRVPHFKHLFTPEIYGILAELGYDFSSSTWLTNTTSRGLPFAAPGGVVEFPLATCPSHPFTVFDTWHSLNATRLSHRIKHRGPRSYVALFRELIDMARLTGSYLNIYLDPLDVIKIEGFDDVLREISSTDLILTTYGEYLDRGFHVAEAEVSL